MSNISRELNLRRWFSDLNDWKASGLTQKQWCQLNGQTLSAFKWHLKQVRAEIKNRQAMTPELETTPASLAPSISAPDFAEVPLKALSQMHHASLSTPQQAVITVKLKTATVNIMAGASPAQIQTVLAVMADV